MNILENANLDLIGYMVAVNTPVPVRLTLDQNRLTSLTGTNANPIDIGATAALKDSVVYCFSGGDKKGCTLDGTIYKTKHCPIAPKREYEQY